MSEGNSSNLRKKTSSELEDQILEVSSELREYIAKEGSESEIVKMNIGELQKKFGARYQIYLQILRDQKTGRAATTEERARQTAIVSALNNLDKYIVSHEQNKEPRTLRERQAKVFEDLRTFLEEGGTEGYVKLPTGAGKTVIFSEFVESTNLKTLIVVPSTILIGQTEEKLQKYAQGLDIGKIYSEAKEHGHHVTIITYQSLVTGVEKGSIKPEDYQMLILDEAHRALSEKRQNAIGKFNQHIKIGFTATPRFSDDKELSDLLNTEVHSMSIREAVEEGIMCPFSVIVANTDTDISNVQIVGGDYSEKELAKAINNQSRNQAALDLYKQLFKDETAVAYCCGIEHAKNLANLFNKNGVSAAVISGNTPRNELEAIIEKYEKGEILVLCNSDILIEGFDEPRASVCLNLRPTTSPVVAEQRGGRVLRLNPKKPDKFATIVDFVDQNKNKKNGQIIFAQVAESAYMEGTKDTTSQINDQSPIPENPSINVSGIRVIVDPEEVMRIGQSLDVQKYMPAPAGWKSYAQIAIEINKPETTVRRVTQKTKNTHPEYFQIYLNENKKIAEYLSPDFARTFIEQYKDIEDAPANWKTANALAFAIGKSYSSVKSIAEDQREIHPEWFKKYYNVKKRVDEHYSPELCEHIMKILAEYSEAPKGWLTVTALARQTDRANATISKVAEKYRDSNPDCFKIYLNAKGRPFEHLSPALVEKIENEMNAFEDAPEGWLPVGRLTALTGKDEKQITRIAEEYREKHPEWFKEYYNLGGGVSEHYAPELIALVQKKFENITPPPEGWMNATQAARETKTGHRLFKMMVQKYTEQFPDKFGFFQSTKKDPIEFYSPEIVDMVKAEKNLQKEAPEGWITMSKIVEQVKRAQATITSAMNKYRESNPEWFGKYYQKSGNKCEHYAPELLEKMINELAITTVTTRETDEGEAKAERVLIESAPPGWMSIGALRKKLHKADETITTAVDKYRASNPEWFKIYKAKGYVTEHYAPELIAKIEADLNTHEVAPAGWKTISSLQDERGKQNFKKIREITDKYRESNPEWFKEYIDARKQVSEHLAPELVKIVKDGLEKMEKNLQDVEGWATSTSLVEQAGAAQQTIQRTAEKYRASNPEWFKDIVGAKVTRIYYHPELAAILISEFKQYEAAPEGWMTTNEVMKSSGTSNFYRIKELAEKYRSSNPGWFKMCKPTRGKPSEYYSPELCQKILTELKA